MSEVARPGEDALIAQFFAPLAVDPGAAGLLDDAAVLRHAGDEEVVATTDALAAGVHFFADDPPGAIAQKALRVNLSDLAAKGARPAGYLLTLALPADWTTEWLGAFAAGLAEDQATYGATLLGGDTIRSPAGLLISITAFGVAPLGRTVRRGGARPGDAVMVTGTIGDAAVGLVARLDPARAGVWRLGEEESGHLADRYLRPRPRVAVAAAVARHARAAMDVSDGLVGDLRRLCRAAGVGATITAEAVPLSAAAARAVAADPALMERVLAGGDDYEILACIAPEAVTAFTDACRAAGVPVSRIGGITAGSAVAVLGSDGRPLAVGNGNFSHF